MFTEEENAKKVEIQLKISELQAELKAIENKSFVLEILKFKATCLCKWMVIDVTDKKKSYFLIKKVDSTPNSVTVYGIQAEISDDTDVTLYKNCRRTFYTTSALNDIKYVDAKDVQKLLKKAYQAQLDTIAV